MSYAIQGNFASRRSLVVLTFMMSLTLRAQAAGTKVHIIAFGKPTPILFANAAAEQAAKSPPIRARPLLVDGRVRELAIGASHEITDRLFVVQRAFRMNDSLPQEGVAHWLWQRGGWILVDRSTGRISPVRLPEFDSDNSFVVWYRDYAAYCGISDDGKTYAIVAQVGRRKPAVRWQITRSQPEIARESSTSAQCGPAVWQRNPTRVTFDPGASEKRTYLIRGHGVDLLTDDNEEEQASK